MDRRQFLAVSGVSCAGTIAGCTGSLRIDDDEANGDGDGTSDDGNDDPGSNDRDGTAERRAGHARSGAGVSGRIDPVGHHLGAETPFYTFAHASPDGQWAVVGSFPNRASTVASTLFDVSDRTSPSVAHALESTNEETRTNDVKFDALRDGLYYRTQEANDAGRRNDGVGREGIEVVDFGWGEGTPEQPTVIGSLETPNVGVHKLTTHSSEPVLYLVDLAPETDVGVIVVDVSEPAAPEIVETVGPTGGCHDVEYDPAREALHAAYISGESEGYVVYDAADPFDPEPIGQFLYADQPDYETLGEPGFELCHQAHPDPDRELVVVGDETAFGLPGGKHVFDVGWDEGSLTDPVPIGFTHSPDARRMDRGETFFWTTHFHDVVTMADETLLVDGGYRQGVWVCNLTDPREPTPTERYATERDADEVAGHGRDTPGPNDPPFAWGALYHEGRDVVVASDSLTGLYTFELSDELARGEDGRGPDGHYDLAAVLERNGIDEDEDADDHEHGDGHDH